MYDTFQGLGVAKKLIGQRPQRGNKRLQERKCLKGNFCFQLADVFNLIAVQTPQVFKVSIINHFVMLSDLGFSLYFVFCFVSFSFFFFLFFVFFKPEVDSIG